jgi:predicted transcriptional regulator
MQEKKLLELSRRERQIMDIIYMLGEATAAEVLENIPEPVGDASIRKLIRIVESKGYLTHRRVGRCYVYAPIVPKRAAGHQALKRLLKVFFQDSAPKAVSALLDISGKGLSKEEIPEILARIQDAKRKGR